MRGMPRLQALAVAALVVLASPALAQAPASGRPRAAERVRLVVNAAGSAGSFTLSDERRYPEYAETTVVHTSQQVKGGYLTDLAVQVRLYRGLGLLVGYSFGSRTSEGGYDAQRPHPLYLDRPRSVQGQLSGFDYSESALHADLAWGGGHGKLGFVVFAGPSFFQLKPELLDQLAFAESYPYDELTVTSAPGRQLSASKTGFNLGGGLDWRLARVFGVGVQLRYATAKARVQATPSASETTLQAGGLQFGGGLRLYF